MTDKIIDGFAYIRPIIGWAMLLVGFLMFIATAVGLLPSFGKGLIARLATSAGWLVLSVEGFDLVAEEAN